MEQWGKDGFSGPPKTKVARGGEQVCRVYSRSKSSRRFGNCFFAFKDDIINGYPGEANILRLKSISAMELEENLNAALWGNTFELIEVFGIPKGWQFQIGSIGHDIRTIEFDGSVGQMIDIGSHNSAVMQVKLAGNFNLEHLQAILAAPISVKDSYRFSYSGPISEV